MALKNSEAFRSSSSRLINKIAPLCLKAINRARSIFFLNHLNPIWFERKFESLLNHKINRRTSSAVRIRSDCKVNPVIVYADVAQWFRVLPCHGRSCEFDPHHLINICSCRLVVSPRSPKSLSVVRFHPGVPVFNFKCC